MAVQISSEADQRRRLISGASQLSGHPGGHLHPVDVLQHLLHILLPVIAVVNVVGMLPDVNAQQGRGGGATKLIERNTTIPTSKSEVFSTASDNQPQVEIHVVQGEREMAGDNKSLGRFILDGIAPAPRGVPQIEVTFNIDANGILNVTAKDKGTGKEQSITIQNSGNMSKSDIEKAAAEAEAHADEDKKKRDTIDARNRLENAIYQAKKMPDEYKGKISDEDAEAIKKAAGEAEEVLKDEDANLEKLEEAIKELGDKLMPIGAKLYQSGEGNAEGADSSDSSDGDAVEGEVVDK